MMKKPKGIGLRVETPTSPFRMSKKTDDGKPKSKAPAHDITQKDDAYDRNFTKSGTPRLNATTGSGSMGQRR